MPQLEAHALVPASPEEVFDFLSDLANHWRLVDRYVQVVSLDGSQGVVRLRGPMGVRRTVRTRVTTEERGRLLVGVAELGGRTRARVTWTLAPDDDGDGDSGGTRVRLAAEVEQATAFDRALLALGGRAWLRRRFAFGLGRLAERFAYEPAVAA